MAMATETVPSACREPVRLAGHARTGGSAGLELTGRRRTPVRGSEILGRMACREPS
jgi:hypothetical protein